MVPVSTQPQQPHRRCPDGESFLSAPCFGNRPYSIQQPEVLSTHNPVLGLGDDSAVLVRGCEPISGAVLRT